MHFNLLMSTNNNKKKKKQQHYSIDFQYSNNKQCKKKMVDGSFRRGMALEGKQEKKCFIAVSSTALCTESPRRHLDRLPSSLRTCCRRHALCVIIYGDFFLFCLVVVYYYYYIDLLRRVILIINNTRTNHHHHRGFCLFPS